MATIVRVKRRNDDEPWDAFIVACKKQKIDGATSVEVADSNSLTAVVKFAGTVQNQEDNVVDHLAKTLTKDQLTVNYKKHIPDITNKIRQKVKEESRENRYKVVNSFRSIGTLNNDEIDDKGMTVIDVEDSVTCSKADASISNDCEFVYDLYYTQMDEDIIPDNDFSICPFEQELVFDNYRDNELNNDQDKSEDSNSESNWRNDYPDSDHSFHSIDDNDIKEAVARLKIDGDESDLSSENSDYIYAVDETDVDNYGYKYAKYKAKFLNELEDNSDDSNDSDCGVRITEIDDDDEVDEDKNDD